MENEQISEYIRQMVRDWLFEQDLDFMIDELEELELVNRKEDDLEEIGNLIHETFRSLLK